MGKNEYVTVREFDKLYERLESIEKIANETSVSVANINGRLMMVPTLISIGIGIFTFFLNFFVTKK